MERLDRAAVILTLVEALHKEGSWCGETHIQKAAYFLEALLGAGLGYDFILYKHGPFSFDLSADLARLRADQILAIEPREPYGPSIVPGSGSEPLRREKVHVMRSFQPKVAFVAKELGTLRVQELESLATALYVTKTSANGDAESRTAKMRELKPHIAVETARQAVREVDRISEVSAAVVA